MEDIEELEAEDPESFKAAALAETPEARAFLRASAGYEFRGIALKPFAAMRQAASLSMGMRFGMLGEDDFFTLNSRDIQGEEVPVQVYREMFQDIIIVLWISHQKDSEVLRAIRRPDDALSKAMAWADGHNIRVGSPAFVEASDTFQTIMTDIMASRSEPNITGSESSKKGRVSGND